VSCGRIRLSIYAVVASEGQEPVIDAYKTGLGYLRLHYHNHLFYLCHLPLESWPKVLVSRSTVWLFCSFLKSLGWLALGSSFETANHNVRVEAMTSPLLSKIQELTF